jgi:hypothetical protein
VWIKNRHSEDLGDTRWNDFIEIEWRIFVSPRIVIPVNDDEWSRRALAPDSVPRLGDEPDPTLIACEKNRSVIATPWFIRWNAMKGDPFHRQPTQNRPRFCFMRAVANIDADLLRFDERLDHCAQCGQNAIE